MCRKALKSRISAVALALLAVMLFAITAFADSNSDENNFLPFDKANVLADDEKANIAEHSWVLFERTGCEIAVVTVDFLGGEDIKAYSEKLFVEQNLRNEKNNGILLLFAIAEENYYAIQGRGIAEELSDSDLKEILLTHCEPYFANGDYGEAVLKTYSAVLSRLENIYSVNTDKTAFKEEQLTKQKEASEKAMLKRIYFGSMCLSLFAAFILFVRFVCSFFGAKRVPRSRRRKQNPNISREPIRERRFDADKRSRRF